MPANGFGRGVKKEPVAIVQAKVNQILMLILRGITRYIDIQQYVSEMDSKARALEAEGKRSPWMIIGKSERQIAVYISRARDIIKAEGERTVKETKDFYRAQLADLYKEARKAGNIREGTAIIRTLMYLDGIGTMNVTESLNYITFDIKLAEKEEEAYRNRLRAYCGIPEDVDILK